MCTLEKLSRRGERREEPLSELDPGYRVIVA